MTDNVVIRKVGTDLYFRAPNDWVKDPNLSSSFESMYKAYSFAVDNHLAQVEVVLLLGGPEDVLVLHVRPQRAKNKP